MRLARMTSQNIRTSSKLPFAKLRARRYWVRHEVEHVQERALKPIALSQLAMGQLKFSLFMAQGWMPAFARMTAVDSTR